jgi:hypothetical protein
MDSATLMGNPSQPIFVNQPVLLNPSSSQEIKNQPLTIDNTATVSGKATVDRNLTAMAGQNELVASSINNIFYVDGVKYTTVAEALAAAVAAGGGVVDARGNQSAAALSLGSLDMGNEAGASTILLGPFAYTATQITLRTSLHLIGMGGGSGTTTGTQITATSTTNPLFVGPPLTTDQPAQHVLISDISLIGPARRSNTADCFFIDASANARGLQGVWNSEFRNLFIGSFGGVSLHFRGASASGKIGVNQVNSFRNVTVYRGKAGGGEALRIEGANYQFFFYDCFFDSVDGNSSIDTHSTANIFIGGGPGSIPSDYPYAIEFFALTTEGTANLIQIDGASQVVFDGLHAEQAYTALLITYGRNGANIPTQGVTISKSSFNANVGVNSGSGSIVNLDSSAHGYVTNVQVFGNIYASASAEPDNWVVNPTYGTGVNLYNNSYGGNSASGQVLNQVATPTTVLKSGTQAGNYTTTSTSFGAVDNTHLAWTGVIPAGWKLIVTAQGRIQSDTASVQQLVRLQDTSGRGTTIAAQDIVPGSGTAVGFSLTGVITGDGNSHTVRLEAKTSNASDEQEIVNTSNGYPTILYQLLPSN